MGCNKNILIGQGGGPTNVINQSLVGIIKQEQLFKSKHFGAINGVNGIVNERFLSLSKLPSDDLNQIANTPGASLGSTRDKPEKKYCTILRKWDISKWVYS